MVGALHALVNIRGWLTDSLLAYLAWAERQEVDLPHYFPARLREGAGVMQTIWQRLQVRPHPERVPRGEADPDDGGTAYAPRRRADAEVAGGPSVVTWDEETAARYRRAVVKGDPGAGKTWLLRRIARQSAEVAWRDLEERRIVRVDEMTWPVRIRLPELGRSPSVAIETLLASFVCEKAALGIELLRQHRAASSGAPVASTLDTRTSPALEVSPRLGAFVVDALRAGRVFVLLDAWDEVPAASRADLEARVRRFAEAFPHARIVLTSRDVGGIDASLLRSSVEPGHSPANLELLALGAEQVDAFVAAWFDGSSWARPPATALQAVMKAHPPMAALARNPLMLTFMCRLAEDATGDPAAIPTRRVELYDRVLRGLLHDWPREDQKSADRTRYIHSEAALTAQLELLAPVAHALVDAGQLGDVSESDLRAIVKQCHQRLLAQDEHHELRHHDATALLDLWKEAGLLVPTGGGEVLFLHRTFQEYLAGIAIVPAALVDVISSDEARTRAAARCAKNLADRLRGTRGRRADWPEPIRLALGYIGLIRQRPEECGDVIRRVIELAPGELGEVVVAMGEAVAEIATDPRARILGAHGSSSRRSRTRIATATREGVTDLFRAALVRTVQAAMRDEPMPSAVSPRSQVGPLPWRSPSRSVEVKGKTRVACGNALARLGDPRFRPEAWFLPDDVVCGFAKAPQDALLGFVRIPAGPFTMGSDPAVDREAIQELEQPQHQVRLPYDYYVGRWPVTVAQFRAFCEDAAENEGFVPGDPACLHGLANHPVVRVDWHEAMAYCRWLSEEWGRELERLPLALRTAFENGWRIGLPSEAEWERAARGDTGRIYPWGDELDLTRANYGDTIGTTSAAGCFPGGATPQGVEELSGNVWEWTRSKLGTYPYDATDGREDLAGNVQRVWRGGSFCNAGKHVRCAFRISFKPRYLQWYYGFRLVLSRSRS